MNASHALAYWILAGSLFALVIGASLALGYLLGHGMIGPLPHDEFPEWEDGDSEDMEIAGPTV